MKKLAATVDRSLKGRTIEASRINHKGNILQLKVGEHSAVIVERWFGALSHRSRRNTWNETLLVRGDVEWVRKEWAKKYAN